MKYWNILICLFPFILPAQYNAIPIHPDLDGEELLNRVVQDYKPSIVLSYGPARDTMFAKIYNINDSISCVYSGHTLYVDPSEDPTQTVFMDGADNGINTEHTYPRSKGAENGFPRSDMNHLFPTRVRVNSDRGNLPFAEIDDLSTLKWYINDQSQSSVPTNNIDLYSEWDGLSFEPKEAHKGNVARAMFYFYTMYESEANAADPNYFDDQISTFCQWHENDPVDSLEWIRAMKIANYQDGKVNPFVLDCTLAGRTYCPDVDAACRSVSNSEIDFVDDILIYPNPARDIIRLQWNDLNVEEMNVQFFSLLGESLSNSKSYSTLGESEIQLDINHLANKYQTVLIRLNYRYNGKNKSINRLLMLAQE